MGVVIPDVNIECGFRDQVRKPHRNSTLNKQSPFTRDLVANYICNSITNLANNRFGTLQPRVAIAEDHFNFDNSLDAFIFDSETRKQLAFGTNDFTIIIKINTGNSAALYPTFISNGDTAAGEWMLRENVGSWNFYGDVYSRISVTHAWTTNTDYILVVRRVGTYHELSVYSGAGVLIQQAGGTSPTADYDAENSNACLGGADANTGRLFDGKIYYAAVWNGRALVSSEVLEFIKHPHSHIVPR